MLQCWYSIDLNIRIVSAEKKRLKQNYNAALAKIDTVYRDILCQLTMANWIFTGFVCLVGFLTSSSTTRLYRGRAPRQSVWQFYVLPHTRQSWETMTSVSASHIILTPTQPVERGRPQRESNPGPPHQESRAPPTELPRPPFTGNREWGSVDTMGDDNSRSHLFAADNLILIILGDKTCQGHEKTNKPTTTKQSKPEHMRRKRGLFDTQ